MFRRAICAIPTNSMNKTFATFGKALKKDRYLESIQAHFLCCRPIAASRATRSSGATSHPRPLQLPQPQLLAAPAGEPRPQGARAGRRVHHRAHPAAEPEPLGGMEADLGPDWERVQQPWLHTLGNLTLTGYNAEYSDRPFAEKRDMTGGFKESPLRLNEGLGVLDRMGIRRGHRCSGGAACGGGSANMVCAGRS